MSLGEVGVYLQALVRWIHVFAAILWIGQTYLFNFMERNLEPTEGRDNVAGSLWMVHGGGFYLLEKQRVPELMPRTLHWFKWESAITWISGAVLITLTYYLGGLLVGPDLPYGPAAVAGVGTIVGSWFLYDLLLRSPLGRNDAIFAVVCLALIVAAHHGLSRVMSARAAYIHVGAALGTIMTANVWLRILPSHHDMIDVAERGEIPDPSIMELGPQRSRHNSYVAIPLVFLMVSNHYPTISYAHSHPSLLLGGLFLLGWVAARFLRA